MKITFNELIHHMMLDPYYGIESDETTSIIKNIYGDHSDNDIYKNFMKRFYFLPCKNDELRHLIYIWCGLMDLPTYLNEKPSNWQRQNILEHWTADFEMRLYELKDFLRKNSWPLPITLFPNEKDNTKRKVDLGKAVSRYLVKDFGTSKSPKSTRKRDAYCAPAALRPCRFATPSQARRWLRRNTHKTLLLLEKRGKPNSIGHSDIYCTNGRFNGS